MYFPYLRGRQFELLALRELTLKKLLSSKVIPVVEPVKLSPTLLKTMEVFVENKKELGIIWNPAVGTFESDMKSDENDSNREKFFNLLNSPYIIKSHIMANDSKKQIEEWKTNKDIHENDLLIICNNRDLIELYLDIFKKTPPRYVLLPDEFRRKIREKKYYLKISLRNVNVIRIMRKIVMNFFRKITCFIKRRDLKDLLIIR